MPDAFALSPYAVYAQLQAAAKEEQASPTAHGHGAIHAALAAMGSGQVADALTTIAALHAPNTQEGNSGLYGAHPSAGRVLATKAAYTVPMALLLDKLENTHPKLARTIAIGVGSLGAMAAMHNTKVMHQADR